MSRAGRVVVLVSGNGSNLQALIDAGNDGSFGGDIVAVVSNRPDAHGLVRARTAGIPTDVVEPAGDGRAGYDRRLAAAVAAHRPDVVVLAGWMRIVTMEFLRHFAVINLHPAEPGAFPGVDAIARAYDAWQAGEISQSGVMVHWVPDEGVDDGPVIAWQAVPFLAGDTEDQFEARMHDSEHTLIVEATTMALDHVRRDITSPDNLETAR